MSALTETTAAVLRDLEYHAVTMFRLRANLAHVQAQQEVDKAVVRYIKRSLRKTERIVQKLSLQFVDLFTQGRDMFDGENRLVVARGHIANTLDTAKHTSKVG